MEEEHWVEYNQCFEDLSNIALICVHKEGTASADSKALAFPSYVSVPCTRETPPLT